VLEQQMILCNEHEQIACVMFLMGNAILSSAVVGSAIMGSFSMGSIIVGSAIVLSAIMGGALTGSASTGHALHSRNFACAISARIRIRADCYSKQHHVKISMSPNRNTVMLSSCNQ
jgi:hypothetical protein